MRQHRPLTSESKAREYAFNLIAYRPRSRHEIRDRLLGRGCAAPLAENLVDELTTRGYLDDRQYACQFVSERLIFRPAGRRYFLFHLEKRGVDRELAEDVLGELLPAERELEAAINAVSGLALDDDKSRLRAYRRLLGRGFAPDLSWRVIQQRDQGEEG